MNTQTPGPLFVKPYGTDTDMFQVYAGEGDYRPDLALFYARRMDKDRNEAEANASLYAAAHTAFDKAGRELGIDAVKLAKLDLASLIRSVAGSTPEQVALFVEAMTP